MADKKIKVVANVTAREDVGAQQNCWGFMFTVTEGKKGNYLEAELSKEDADAMKEAGRLK